VEDGASILTRTGASSIVCIGSMGVQEAAKAMRTVHSTGASTMEGAIDRLQNAQSGTRSAIPITFVPTDIGPPAWARNSTLCFHPTVPAVTTLAPCVAGMNVCYDPEFIATCMKATKTTSAAMLGLLATAIDAEAMAPGFVSSRMPKLDVVSQDAYANLSEQAM